MDVVLRVQPQRFCHLHCNSNDTLCRSACKQIPAYSRTFHSVRTGDINSCVEEKALCDRSCLRRSGRSACVSNTTLISRSPSPPAEQLNRLMYPNFYGPRAGDPPQRGSTLKDFDVNMFDRETILYPPHSCLYNFVPEIDYHDADYFAASKDRCFSYQRARFNGALGFFRVYPYRTEDENAAASSPIAASASSCGALRPSKKHVLLPTTLQQAFHESPCAGRENFLCGHASQLGVRTDEATTPSVVATAASASKTAVKTHQSLVARLPFERSHAYCGGHLFSANKSNNEQMRNPSPISRCSFICKRARGRHLHLIDVFAPLNCRNRTYTQNDSSNVIYDQRSRQNCSCLLSSKTTGSCVKGTNRRCRRLAVRDRGLAAASGASAAEWTDVRYRTAFDNELAAALCGNSRGSLGVHAATCCAAHVPLRRVRAREVEKAAVEELAVWPQQTQSLDVSSGHYCQQLQHHQRLRSKSSTRREKEEVEAWQNWLRAREKLI